MKISNSKRIFCLNLAGSCQSLATVSALYKHLKNVWWTLKQHVQNTIWCIFKWITDITTETGFSLKPTNKASAEDLVKRFSAKCWKNRRCQQSFIYLLFQFKPVDKTTLQWLHLYTVSGSTGLGTTNWAKYKQLKFRNECITWKYKQI